MDKAYYLTDEDRRLLRRFDQYLKSSPANGHNSNGSNWPSAGGGATLAGSPELYIVKIPDEGIPARSGIVLGSADCEVQKAGFNDPDWELGEVLVTDTEKFVITVLNLYKTPVYPWANDYTIAHRDKYGRWLCEKPDPDFFAILNTDLNQGSTCTFEFVKDPASWTRTGVTATGADYYLNLTKSLSQDTKCVFTCVNGVWVWKEAYCFVTDTPPDAAE